MLESTTKYDFGICQPLICGQPENAMSFEIKRVLVLKT